MYECVLVSSTWEQVVLYYEGNHNIGFPSLLLFTLVTYISHTVSDNQFKHQINLMVSCVREHGAYVTT